MKKKMLIVDDNESLKEALQMVFEDDYELYFAGSGEEAIKAFGESVPEVVLMDFQMPGLNGVQTMQILQEQSKQTQMIIMSAYDERERVRSAFASGAFDFVPKPFDVFGLKNMVDQAATHADKILNFSNAIPSVEEREANFCKREMDNLVERTLQAVCI